MTRTTAQITTIGFFVMAALLLFMFLLISFGGGRLAVRTLDYKMYFYSRVRGLKEGSQVMFRGVTIGQVSKIRLVPMSELKKLECHSEDHGVKGLMCEKMETLWEGTDDSNDRRFPIEVSISLDPEYLGIRQGLWTRLFHRDAEEIFYLRELIEELVCKNGFCGELQMMSVLTGQLYIEMRFRQFADEHEEKRTRFLFTHGVIPTEMSMLQKLMDNLSGRTKKMGTNVDSLNKLIGQVCEFIDNGGTEKLINDISSLISNVKEISAKGTTAIDDGQKLLRQISDLSNQFKPILSDVRRTVEKFPKLADDGQAALDKLNNAIVELQQLEFKAKGVLDAAFPSDNEVSFSREKIMNCLNEFESMVIELKGLIESLSSDPQMLIMGRE